MNGAPKKPAGRYSWRKVPPNEKSKLSDPVKAKYYPFGNNFDNWVSGFNTGSDMWFKYGRALGFCQGIALACTVIVGGELVGMAINDIRNKREHEKRIKENKRASC